MQIEWKNIEKEDYLTLDKWLSKEDKFNLCMETKSWEQTANDINECLKYMNGSQFKNIMGYINNHPVVALMFGIEHIDALNLYCITVNPKFRGMGIAKDIIDQLLAKDKSLKLSQPFNRVILSVKPQNTSMIKLLKKLNFTYEEFDGEYHKFYKNCSKIKENNIEK